MRVLYLLGGDGGLWFWYSQSKSRIRVRPTLRGERCDIANEPGVGARVILELQNLGDSTTSVEPTLAVNALTTDGRRVSCLFQIKSEDRTLAPHTPRTINFDAQQSASYARSMEWADEITSKEMPPWGTQE